MAHATASSSSTKAALLLAAILAVFGSIGLHAATLRMPAGYDMFITAADGRSFFYLGASSERPIPQGFFGCLPIAGACLPSDAITAPIRVAFEGLATGDLGLEPSPVSSVPCKWVSDADKYGMHCADGVGHFSSTNPEIPAEPEVDTIVLRDADLVFEAIGDQRSAPIELVSLSLRGIEPVEILYGDGRASQRFQVTVSGPRVKGARGTMTISRTGESSGTYVSRLPVSMEIKFQNTKSGGPAPAAPIALDLDFVGADVPWMVVEEKR